MTSYLFLASTLMIASVGDSWLSVLACVCSLGLACLTWRRA